MMTMPMRAFRTGVALAALLVATPTAAWCGNTATNCAPAGPPVHHRQPTLPEQVEEAQDTADRAKSYLSDLESKVGNLESKVSDLEYELRKLKAAQP